MVRSATKTSDKVSALQYLHIVKADLFTLLAEAESGQVLPTMKARRGTCMTFSNVSQGQTVHTIHPWLLYPCHAVCYARVLPHKVAFQS